MIKERVVGRWGGGGELGVVGTNCDVTGKAKF